MRCQKIRQLLSCRLDGMIDDEQLNIVNKHLENCRACRSYWHYLQADAKLLRDLPEMVPPTGFSSKLRKKIEDTKLPKVGAPSRKGPLTGLPGFITRPWFAGVAALLIFVFGITAFGDVSNIFNELGNRFHVSQVDVNPEPSGKGDLDPESPDKSSEGTGDAMGLNPFEQTDSINNGAGDEGEDADTKVNEGNDGRETKGNDRDKHGTSPDNQQVENNPTSGKDSKTGEFYTTSGEQTIVIRNVKIRLAVSDLDEARKQLNAVTDEHCVTLVKEETRDQTNEVRYAICVPTPEMHNAVKKIEEIGRVIISVVENEDITKKYSQLQGRIN
ncbi:MAG TPA: zf-HC2 domain-containing protein, partial [Clostridia bacterium]|nr:zf-HC2 domain-containing protein [Clostridia bacterium]